ncbi:density-regulated protein DRP1 [Neoconidiobolus thromboides FSU 785]|nr:density-regulated protein DRP1 [Neoconidiobolus thromboides FSU 785]
MADIETEVQQELPTIEKIDVYYCQVCTLPSEYCEYGPTFERCKQSLKEDNKELFNQLYGTDDAPDSTTNVDSRAIRKAAEKIKKEEEKKDKSRITIKRIERNKRKYITSIQGLEVFGVELKKAAKLFANKFACGSSVTKTATGQEEIVVQGDVSEELLELITKTWPEIEEDKVDLKEDKKGKKSS